MSVRIDDVIKELCVNVKTSLANGALSHLEDATRYAHGGIIYPKSKNKLMFEFNKSESLINLRKTMKKYNKIDSIYCRNWDFNIPHIDMLNVDELTKTLSRENPIVFVTSGTHSEKILINKNKKGDDIEKTIKYISSDESMMVFIHSSIISKAELVYGGIPKWVSPTNKPSVFKGLCPHSEMHSVTEWVKKVKKAMWGNINKHKRIRVIVPKI